jgi:hypothetical protein
MVGQLSCFDGMEAMQYKSSSARQARLFYHSRELWRQRAAAKQQEIRALRVKVRDLTDSRAHWKERAGQLAEQMEQLQARSCQQQIEGQRLGGR